VKISPDPLLPVGSDRLTTDPRLHAVLNVAASALPGLFTLWLLPYVFNRLGAEAVGIWAFATTVATFASVVDAGLAFSVIRQSAVLRVADRSQAVAEIHAASAVYVVVAGIVVLVGILLALSVDRLLNVSAPLAGQAPIAAFLVALDVAFVLGTSTWAGILRGQGRFHVIFVASAVGTVVGAATALALVPSLGLAGAALSMLALHAVGRLVVLTGVRQNAPWFRAIPQRPNGSSLRAISRFSLPMLISAIATQFGIGTDILVVGALIGPTAAGYVALGLRIPAFALGVVVVALDAAFPWLVRRLGHDGRADHLTITRLIQSASLLGVTIFGLLATHAATILSVWLGADDPISVAFFVIYCGIWTVNLPARVLNLTLTASDVHHRIPIIVVIEHLFNLACSIALVATIGPIGAAISTLAAIVLSNGIGFPILARSRVGIGLATQARAALGGGLAGATAVALGLIAGQLVRAVPLLELVVASSVSFVIAAAAQSMLVRARRLPDHDL
jgi:O-antigen/teichoic acid export membrane protein